MTYDEHIEDLNSAAIHKGMSNMTEVETIEIATKTSEHIIKELKKTGHCRKEDLKTAQFAIAEITYLSTKYIAMLYIINGAQILLRATDPVAKKFYIPNEIWIMGTNENDEEELYHLMSIGERVEIEERNTK